METLTVAAADALAVRLTAGRMRVNTTHDGTWLVDHTSANRVGLLPYQMTKDGIERAITELSELQQ